MSQEYEKAYAASPYATLSADYFSRFSRDTEAQPGTDETAIDGTWTLVLPAQPDKVTAAMA